MTCELCSYKGGAYKETDSEGKWIHMICSNWIPDVFLKEVEGTTRRYPTLASLDKKRFRLKCGWCKLPGACVQCTFGRCIAACHPWCMIHDTRGWTKRVVKVDEDTEPITEMYCKVHAHCVMEPPKYKPAPKAKASASGANSQGLAMADEDDYHEYRPKRKSFGPRLLSMAHQNKPIGTELLNKNKGSGSWLVRTFSEWPGQAEGEGLDLDHFWKVVGMAYPEDHEQGWVDFMTEPVAQNVSIEPTDEIFCMPA